MHSHCPDVVPPATIGYVARCTAEYRTKREIISCLKRYIIREVYQPVPTHPTGGLRSQLTTRGGVTRWLRP
jgi:hypothetical protein